MNSTTNTLAALAAQLNSAVSLANELAVVQAQLNGATSVAKPERLAVGSNMHHLPTYQARYAAEQAELRAEMAANPYTSQLAR